MHLSSESRLHISSDLRSSCMNFDLSPLNLPLDFWFLWVFFVWLVRFLLLLLLFCFVSLLLLLFCLSVLIVYLFVFISIYF